MAFDDRIRAALDRALADVREAAQAEMDELRQLAEHSTASLSASSARLSDCIHAIDEAPSLGAVLTVVAGCARLEARRAGIILIKDGTLTAYPSRAEVPSEQAKIVSSAAQARALVVDGDSAAFPIALGGHVVAVLSTAAPASPEALAAIDLLVRHAGRVLEAMTISQITGLAPLSAAPDSSAGGAP